MGYLHINSTHMAGLSINSTHGLSINSMHGLSVISTHGLSINSTHGLSIISIHGCLIICIVYNGDSWRMEVGVRSSGTPEPMGQGGQLPPLPFLAGGQGGKGALFQKYNINEI